jgi:hypothetical protein
MQTELLATIRHEGFAVITRGLDDASFVELARDLGEIVDDTRVRIVPGKRTYLARPDPIPLHTDHPKASLIAWRCEAQDERAGASVLVDGHAVLANLDARTRAILAEIELPAMVRFGDVAKPTPIVSRDGRVFYAPWLEPIERAVENHHALVAFREALSRTPSRAVRLEAGHVLVVDNHRVLHGRSMLLTDSRRLLRRLWLAASPLRAQALN